MKAIVRIDGYTYIGQKTDLDKNKRAESFAASLPNSVWVTLPLEDGSILVLGKDAIQRAQFIFKD